MATSGTVTGNGVNSGCSWSEASAPWEGQPTVDRGVSSNFNVADGCPRMSTLGQRSRMIARWSNAKLASNGFDCDPGDFARVIVENAFIGYEINTTGFTEGAHNFIVRGYDKRTSLAGESWNDAVAIGIDGVSSPSFTFSFAGTASPSTRTYSGANLNALIQAQLRIDGSVSLIEYIENDTSDDDFVYIYGGSNNTTPWGSGNIDHSIGFDWSLESGPVLTMGSQKTYRSGSGASVIDATLTVASTPNIQTAEIAIQAGESGDSIAVGALPSGITASELAGVITLTGPASAADFQTALRAMTFSSIAVASDTLRIIRFFLTDVDSGTSGAVDFNVLVHGSTEAATLTSQAAVMNIAALAGFLSAAASRPVDIGLICDSNGVQVTYSGHIQGLTYAWAQAFPCWGSGIAPMTNESNGWLAPPGDVQVGDVVTTLGQGAVSGVPDTYDFSGTPAAFEARVWSTGEAGAGPDCADYVIPAAPGGVVRDADDAGLFNQLIVRTRHPMWSGGELIYGCRVYVPDTDPCPFIYPSFMTGYATGAAAIAWPLAPTPVSLPESGFGSVFVHCPIGNIIAANEVANNDGSAVRVSHSYYTGTASDAEVRGEYGMLYQCLMDGSKNRGVRVSRFMVAGGQPTKYITDELVDRADEAIAEYFRFVADCQRTVARNTSLAPVYLVHILEGINDSIDNASGSTVYPRGGPAEDDPTNHGNSAIGFTNNTTAIINRLRDIWVTTCGFSESNLYFLLGGSHPMPSGAQRTMLETTMPAAIAAICADSEYRSKVAGLDGFKIRVPDHLAAVYGTQRDGTEYDHASDGADPAHLNERGYIDYDSRLVGTLMGEAYAAGLVGSSASTAYRNR